MFRSILRGLFLGIVISLGGSIPIVQAQHCPAERTCGATCCSNAQLCYQGKCTNPGKTCTKSSDCSAGQFCAIAFKKCLAKIKNNTTCKYRPPIGKFSPSTLWEWKSSPILPTYKQVMMTPVVMALQDTNKNGKIDVGDMPSVIFISHYNGGSYAEDGVLRALRGNDGKEIFTVTDKRYRVNGLGSLAVADIDNDGKPDIVASRFAGRNLWNAGLHAFDNTGKHKWTTHYSNGKIANLPVSWGGASIADLDGDGNVEVILGKAVIRGKDGLVLCQGAGSKGNGSPGQRMPLSVIADLDGDGKQEIVTGNAAYRHDCKLMWSNSEGDGYTAVADFNKDGKPEIVVVSWAGLRIQDGLTGKVLLRTTISGDGQGPPTVGDFNGDGFPDVALAGRKRYVVYSPNLATKKFKLLWSYTTRDFSSGRTGSSVFDFEGDKKAEVVYNDERFARVFDGSTGKVLFSSANNSSTSLEYPVVVDVNNDGRANIVVSSNHGTMAHIRVFQDRLDNWVDTRNIWNQHAYSITNICTGPKDPYCPAGSKFGQVPKKPLQNWKVAGLNNFRQNVQGKGLFEAADLVLLDMRASWLVGCKGKVEVGVWAYNKGAKKIPTGIPVTFYQGTVGSKVKLITLRINRELEPGEGAWLKATLTIVSNRPKSLYAAVDDDGKGQSSRNECDKKNNGLAYNLPAMGGGEKCDGQDNDCDGQIDETWPDKGKTCAVGVGACKKSGKWNCKSDGSALTCNVQTGTPAPEVCDGKDNNCNGQIDENLVRKCQSACGSGQETCSKGTFSGCTAPKPKKEICNGKDDDCDGTPDNDIPTTACQSACGKGNRSCSNGVLVCDAPKPKPEICNGKDDDCNGQTDDNIQPKACSGTCGTGTASCQNGQWAGCSGKKPEPELCNGKDDDCNGLVDDKVRRPCKSDCGAGYESCEAGTWKACTAPRPQPELCNGKDDNCDGKADNDAKCPPDSKCSEGLCKRKCRNGECPAGLTCTEGFCEGRDPCLKLKCPSGTQCIAARCVDPCSLVTCSEKLVCEPGTGKCYKDDCYVKGCPKGKVCTEGICQPDPCVGVNCKPNQFCRADATGSGKCVDSCAGVSCDTTEKCIDGACQPDPEKSGPCKDKKCAKDERCEQGICIKDPCFAVTCDLGHICKKGQCVGDPCLGIKCPNGERCVDGQCYDNPNPKEPSDFEPVGTNDEQQSSESPSESVTSEFVIEHIDGSSSSTGQHHDQTEGESNRYGTGCGCQTNTAPPVLFVFFFLLLLLGRVRRSGTRTL